MAIQTLQTLPLDSKRVLLRVDYNVPQDQEGTITDDSRIRASLPTLEALLAKNCRITLMSHLGRPKGKGFEAKYSMKPVAAHLASLLGREVALISDLADNGGQNQIQMLENLRFSAGETSNDPEFAKALAAFGDVYINDAFGAAHRAHASIAAVCAYFEAKGAGLLLEKELHYLLESLRDPARPFVAILGGSKISDKLPVIKNLVNKVDRLLIGGGMSFTFLKAMGFEIGNSLLEADFVAEAGELLETCKSKGVELLLPLDHVVADAFKSDANASITRDQNIEPGMMGLDIGPETIQLFSSRIRDAKTVVWNGPMGVFEWEAFSTGTISVGEAMADCKGITIIGGGDSVAAVNQAGVADKMSHISTGGGASLELLGGDELPGVVALES